MPLHYVCVLIAGPEVVTDAVQCVQEPRTAGLNFLYTLDGIGHSLRPGNEYTHSAEGMRRL